jgi:hypothetical protein
MKTTNKNNTGQAMQQLQATKHFISKKVAGVMIRKYRVIRNRIGGLQKMMPLNLPVLPVSISYHGKAIRSLLATAGCCGIRIYPAINSNDELTLVLVGIDGKGENIYEGAGNTKQSAAKTGVALVVDEGQTSPPYPAPKW